MMKLNYMMVPFSVNYLRLYPVHHKKKQDKLPTNPHIHIYINRVNNSLVFKIKNGFKLKL